jgi:hypothetical protein
MATGRKIPFPFYFYIFGENGVGIRKVGIENGIDGYTKTNNH